MKKVVIMGILICVLCSLLVSAGSKFILKVNSTEPISPQQAIEDLLSHPYVLYFKLGVYYFYQNKFDDAIHAFKKAIELKPDFAEAYHNIGVSYYKQNNLDDAIAQFQKSIEVQDTYVTGHFSLALAYYEKKEYDLALSEFKKVVELNPQNVDALFNLGIIYVEKFRANNEKNGEDLQQALEYYTLCLKVNQNYPDARENKEIVKNVLQELTTQ